MVDVVYRHLLQLARIRHRVLSISTIGARRTSLLPSMGRSGARRSASAFPQAGCRFPCVRAARHLAHASCCTATDGGSWPPSPIHSKGSFLIWRRHPACPPADEARDAHDLEHLARHRLDTDHVRLTASALDQGSLYIS
jgi:hypothetical protein